MIIFPMTIFIAICMTIIIAATPILLAALGELITEKSGVLNLGVEGMMLMGAFAAFAIAYLSGNMLLGLLAGAFAGLCTALIFALLTLKLAANQVASGLALTIFGTGLSAMLGAPFVGKTIQKLPALFPAVLSEHETLKLIFGYDALVYFSLLLTLCLSYFLNKTRAGLTLRAVGSSDTSAHALGVNVLRIRLYAVLFGGVCAGLAGAYFSLALTPLWAEKLTAGRGWIALALVVFAAWKPLRLLFGAYLFGAVMTLELHSKAAGFALPSELVASTPYLVTILVLILISMRHKGQIRDVPACLGKPFSAR
jgi:general nucleoside transport system permease protein